MTDDELAAWLVDCRGRTSADARLEDAFCRLAERCKRAEKERDLRRLESLIREHGATALREALRR